MFSKRKLLGFTLIILLIFATIGCSATQTNKAEQGQNTNQIAQQSVEQSTEAFWGKTKMLKAHFIDVGQADAILVQLPNGKNILIDGGNVDDSEDVLKYLRLQKVKKLAAIIATHPHEDHIGGLDKVILNLPVDKIYMPKVAHTSRCFEHLLKTIKQKQLKITIPKAGQSLDFDKEIHFQVFAPNGGSYENLNNYSIVLKITYGKTAFLLCGDAEHVSEKEMLAKGYDLKADVLKVAHHGSRGSSSSKFLQAIEPRFAVVSVGKNNDYGHPHLSIIKRLQANRVKIYRTDQDGNIIISSDGTDLTIKTQRKQ
ncbi:MBL fold metallo-hydrolase [Bacillota bacterium LX-D]|nr:MBL fold metallo-hydrolase [Bacillota bacterium LX-D]